MGSGITNKPHDDGVRGGADRILIFGGTNHGRSAERSFNESERAWFYGLSLTRVKLRCETEAHGFWPMPQ
jgi:hypothetical protein